MNPERMLALILLGGVVCYAMMGLCLISWKIGVVLLIVLALAAMEVAWRIMK